MKKSIAIVLILLAMCGFSFAATISPTGMNQGDVYNLLNGLRLFSQYHHMQSVSVNLTASPNQQDLTSVGVQTYTSTATGITENPTVTTIMSNYAYVNGGKVYVKTFGNIDLSGITGASALPVQPISTVRTYMIGINSSGTYGVSYALGDYQPAMRTGFTPIWTLKVTTSAAATYTFGTTKLNATGVTFVLTEVQSLSTGANKISLTY